MISNLIILASNSSRGFIMQRLINYVAIEKIRWRFLNLRGMINIQYCDNTFLIKRENIYIYFLCTNYILYRFVNLMSSVSVWSKTVRDTIILVISQGCKILLHRRYKSREPSLWTISKRGCKVRDIYNAYQHLRILLHIFATRYRDIRQYFTINH